MPSSFRITLEGSGRSFPARGDEAVLAAATRQSIWIPARCRSGSCGSCVAQITSGEVAYAVRPSMVLAHGTACLCLAEARSDLTVRVEELAEAPRLVRRLPATVVSVSETSAEPASMTLLFPHVPRAGLAVACAISITAPAGYEARLAIVSQTSQHVFVVEVAQGDGGRPAASLPCGQGDIIQVELWS